MNEEGANKKRAPRSIFGAALKSIGGKVSETKQRSCSNNGLDDSKKRLATAMESSIGPSLYGGVLEPPPQSCPKESPNKVAKPVRTDSLNARGDSPNNLSASDQFQSSCTITQRLSALPAARAAAPPAVQQHAGLPTAPERTQEGPDMTLEDLITVNPGISIQEAVKRLNAYKSGADIRTLMPTENQTKKKDPRGPAGQYIPPHARRAQDLREAFNMGSSAPSSGSNLAAPQFVRSKYAEMPGYRPPVQVDVIDLHELKKSAKEELESLDHVSRCSIVVSGFLPNLPAHTTDALLKPLVDRGGRVSWISLVDAVVVFPTEAAARKALDEPINVLLRASLLKIYENNHSKHSAIEGKSLQPRNKAFSFAISEYIFKK